MMRCRGGAPAKRGDEAPHQGPRMCYFICICACVYNVRVLVCMCVGCVFLLAVCFELFLHDIEVADHRTAMICRRAKVLKELGIARSIVCRVADNDGLRARLGKLFQDKP